MAVLILALNRVLAMDPEAAAMMEPLDGKLLGVSLGGINTSFYARVSGARLEIVEQPGIAPDLVIEGGVFDLAMLGMAASPESVMRDRRITMSGDVELAHAMKTLLQAFDPDWEEALSQIVGDFLARKTGVGVRSLRDWLATARTSVTDTVGEILTEEKRLLPTRLRYQQHQVEVERLRDDVERLCVRIDRLLPRIYRVGKS
ncbi:MAG: sterol-binding protein [Gammaproteobacteria bacterium]|nr:MAG: sterol-binding protein [Gammaproteobacteria bacterium]